MGGSSNWDESQIPRLDGKVMVVTGGNSGIGYEAARAMAEKGARVVLACRSEDKAVAARDRIRAHAPQADVDFLALDLASLESVRHFAQAYRERFDRLDGLCNNAGVMALPYSKTRDGFEMQFGTNHLGHFALTGLLLELLLATDGSRVVNVASTAHRIGRIRFKDLHSEGSYHKWKAYGQSKLANLLFTYELDRRLRQNDHSTLSVACHPGYAATNLQFAGPRQEGSHWRAQMMSLGNRLFSQNAAEGALPTLFAATAPGVQGGDYYGPGGFFEMWGPPKKVQSNSRSHDPETARRLWEVSQELTGVTFGALDRPSA